MGVTRHVHDDPPAARPDERKVFLEAYRALAPNWAWGGNLLA